MSHMRSKFIPRDHDVDAADDLMITNIFYEGVNFCDLRKILYNRILVDLAIFLALQKVIIFYWNIFEVVSFCSHVTILKCEKKFAEIPFKYF